LESGSPQGISTQLLTWQGKALKASGEKRQLFLSRFLIFRSGQVSKRIKDFMGFIIVAKKLRRFHKHQVQQKFRTRKLYFPSKHLSVKRMKF
jgi:hypothetical protein